MIVGKIIVRQMTVGQMTVGQMIVGQIMKGGMTKYRLPPPPSQTIFLHLFSNWNFSHLISA